MVGCSYGLRGRTAVRPYGWGLDFDQGVEMVGHDDPFMEFERGSNLFRSQPFLHNNFTPRGEMHFGIFDRSKQVLPLVGAGGDEIESGAAVIVARQPHGTTLMAIGVVWH